MNLQNNFTDFSHTVPCSVDALARGIVADATSYASGPGLFSNVVDRPASVFHAIEDLKKYSDAKVSIEDLTLSLPAKLTEVVDKLRRFGVVVLPNLIEGAALDNMRAEFRALLDHLELLGQKFQVTDDAENRCVRLDRATMEVEIAPETAAFYDAPLLAKIAEFYYGHEDFVLNRQIFVHETLPTERPLSGDLHFDVSRMLKFWIYLEDGREDSGAIRMSPGSNLLFGKLREEFSDRLIPKAQICNKVDETAHPAMPIEAPAGSLVIFDTDTAHGAGRVAPGKVRRIVRGHTMETKYVARGKKRASA